MEGSWYGLVDISTGLLVLICASPFSPQKKTKPQGASFEFWVAVGTKLVFSSQRVYFTNSFARARQ